MEGQKKEGFSTILYVKKEELDLSNLQESTSASAREVIEKALPSDALVIRVSVNSPAFIEKALPLTKENLRAIVSDC